PYCCGPYRFAAEHGCRQLGNLRHCTANGGDEDRSLVRGVAVSREASGRQHLCRYRRSAIAWACDRMPWVSRSNRSDKTDCAERTSFDAGAVRETYAGGPAAGLADLVSLVRPEECVALCRMGSSVRHHRISFLPVLARRKSVRCIVHAAHLSTFVDPAIVGG